MARVKPKFDRALIVTYPHGGYIASGRKKILVKSKPYHMEGESLLIVERKKALAVVVPGKMKEITLKQFRALRPKHLVSEAERLRWWGGHRKLYMYPIIQLKKLKKPISVEYPNGAQVFVKKENIKGSL